MGIGSRCLAWLALWCDGKYEILIVSLLHIRQSNLWRPLAIDSGGDIFSTGECSQFTCVRLAFAVCLDRMKGHHKLLILSGLKLISPSQLDVARVSAHPSMAIYLSSIAQILELVPGKVGHNSELHPSSLEPRIEGSHHRWSYLIPFE